MIGGPLALVFGPVLYILAAAISLSTFKISYTALSRFTYQKSGNAVWQAVQPALKNQLTWLESIFGAPATFTPTTTHVILVAILLCLMVNAEGNRRR